jgi:hypothetical protein
MLPNKKNYWMRQELVFTYNKQFIKDLDATFRILHGISGQRLANNSMD